MDTFTHCTDTLHTDNTLSSDQISVSCDSLSAHSRVRSRVGCLAELASLAAMSKRAARRHDLLAQYCNDPKWFWNKSSSSTCSVTEVAASTIPGTDSASRAPIDRLRQEERGHEKCGTQENNKSSTIFGGITSIKVTRPPHEEHMAQQQWEAEKRCQSLENSS